MAKSVQEGINIVKKYILQIKEITSIKTNVNKHFQVYSRPNDKKDIKTTLLELGLNFSDLKIILKNLRISDYYKTTIDEINIYGKLPCFLVKIKNKIVYIKVGIKYEELFLYCFSFYEQEYSDYDNRPYKEYKEKVKV